MATTTTAPLSLFEVYVTDSRFTDAHSSGIIVESVRAASAEDAKLKTLLRLGYGEDDLQYLNIKPQVRMEFIRPINEDAVSE